MTDGGDDAFPGRKTSDSQTNEQLRAFLDAERQAGIARYGDQEKNARLRESLREERRALPDADSRSFQQKVKKEPPSSRIR